jgi:hypothetical protein
MICVLVLVHANYWFVSGQQETATNLRVGLAAAQGVLGLVGAFWFWSRARGASL